MQICRVGHARRPIGLDLLMGSSNAASQSTSASLLSRVRSPGDHAAWSEFQGRYRELLLRFCRKRGLQHADAEDAVQSVFVSLARTLPQFTYDPQRGRFRDYLYRCLRNTLSEWHQRTIAGPQALDTSMQDALAAPDDNPGGGDAALWEQEWVAHHFRHALERIRAEFDAHNVEMFERNVSGEPVAQLVSAFGVSEEAFYAARRRIRLRLQDLIAEQVRDEDRVDGESVQP